MVTHETQTANWQQTSTALFDMPRRPRLEVPGVPMHLTHRGVNRAAIFLETLDYLEYRRLLRQVLGEFEVSVHAYVLMTNHAHLLVSSACIGAVSRAMSVLGKHYCPASIENIDARVHSGKAASSLAWWSQTITYCGSTVTSNSTRCARQWSSVLRITRGPACIRTSAPSRIHSSRRILYSLRSLRATGARPVPTERGCGRASAPTT